MLSASCVIPGDFKAAAILEVCLLHGAVIIPVDGGIADTITIRAVKSHLTLLLPTAFTFLLAVKKAQVKIAAAKVIRVALRRF